MNKTETKNLEKYIENILNVPVEPFKLSYTIRPEYDMSEEAHTGKFLVIITKSMKGKRPSIVTYFVCDTETEGSELAKKYIEINS